MIVDGRQACVPERYLVTQCLVNKESLSYTATAIDSDKLSPAAAIEFSQLPLFLLPAYQFVHKMCFYFSAKIQKVVIAEK
jgi:hypothetical protein